MVGEQRLVRAAGSEESTAGLPVSAEIMRVFTGLTADWHPAHPVLEVAASLVLHHCEQWSAENTSRDCADDDGAVAAAKRHIDAMNRTRVEQVDRIDAWAEHVIRDDPVASLHTETLGQLIDRLAVAWVRARRLGELADRHPDQRAEARRALTLLVQLCEAYDDLVRDLGKGRRRLPVWRSLKRYGTRS